MKRLFAIILAGGLLAGVIGTAEAAKLKQTKVFEDVAGDSGNAEQAQAIPGFDQLGLDLVGGSIATVGKNLRFTVTTAAMPANGFFPEGVRLLWNLNVGGTEYKFTVKSFDIGKPDVVAGGVGQERIGKVYANGVVRLEECKEESVGITLVQCIASLYTEPKFDPAAKTITWEIPLTAVKAKKGTPIAAGTSGHAGTNCPVCFIAHYAERSLSPNTTIDAATISGIHKV